MFQFKFHLFFFLEFHDYVIKWKLYTCYWPIVREIHRWSPLTKSMTWSFNVFFVLHLNKCLRKQTRRRWFETQSCSLWRHCNVGNESVLSNTVEFHIIAPQHDDVIKWKHFPRYWPFVRGIHRFPVNSPHKGQRRGALMFSLICVWINGWVNDREAGDLRRYHAHYDVTVMDYRIYISIKITGGQQRKCTPLQSLIVCITRGCSRLFHILIEPVL